jgi:hypothetical protein
MINTMLQVPCHIVLAFRAKEKIKIVRGKEPEDLGWQPIASDRIHFETAFTLILPPHSLGTPDMKASEFRKPYDTMVKNEQINEDLGKRLAEWAAGGAKQEKKEEKKEDKKETFLEIMNREYQRLGKDRFYEILKAYKVQAVEEVTDRKNQAEIYRAMMVVK